MCNFKSAIVLRDESLKGGFRLIMSPWTESHSELCILHKLNDGKSLHFARVEYSPPSMDTAYLVDTYKLKIDESRTPEWFDDEMKELVTEKLRSYVKSIIVDGDVKLLIGGPFIIAPNAKIEAAHSMVIAAMCGGTLTAMCGGTLTEMRGGTLTAMCGGTLTAMCGGTLTAMCGGTLQRITEWFSGLIGKIGANATVVKDERPKKV